jgi:hypothetical protein
MAALDASQSPVLRTLLGAAARPAAAPSPPAPASDGDGDGDGDGEQ